MTARPVGTFLGPLLGVVALLGFALVASSLREFVWYDAGVAGWVAAHRGCDSPESVGGLSDAAPYLGIVLVLVGTVLAVRRGARGSDVACTLLLLAVGLLFLEAVKLLFERARPDVRVWKMVGDSFPSGHVGNAVLCAGTATGLIRRSPPTRHGAAGWALGVTGVVLIAAVAAARVYLGRHWASDVAGSVLLGLGFLGVTSWRSPAARTVALAVAALTTGGLLLTAATGQRFAVSSASVPEARPHFRLRLARSGTVDGTWVPRATHPGYVQLARSEATFPIDVPSGRSVLVVAARASACRSLEVEVDGIDLGRDRLGKRWTFSVFTLPRLRPGRHELRLRVPAGDAEPLWALRGVRVFRTSGRWRQPATLPTVREAASAGRSDEQRAAR